MLASHSFCGPNGALGERHTTEITAGLKPVSYTGKGPDVLGDHQLARGGEQA
jgi:hypothetical protein